MSEFTNDFSKEIFDLTYKLNDETIDNTFKRIAKAVATFEKNKDFWEDSFYDLLQDFKFVPGGRILSNAGSGIKGTSLTNCFVDGFIGEDQDSMNSIMDALKRQAMILKSEGGYGFNVSVLRPKGAFIEGISNETPGSVKIMEMWDKQSEVITEGSGRISNKKNAKKKIRKGAQMAVLGCWHPDIEDFIVAKQTPNRLTKFNMSVGMTAEFMAAVVNHLSWKLEFPDYDSSQQDINIKDFYKKHWDGNIKKWKESNLPTKVYKEYKDANELWDLIMKSTYNRNEPGILFLDLINDLNNLWYLEDIQSVNPCVVGNTLVLTNIGWIKIKNLSKHKKKYENIKIITRNNSGVLHNSELQWVDLSLKNEKLLRVDFSNNEFLLVNKEHKFYNSTFNEKRVSDLNVGDSIIGGSEILFVLKITELEKKEDVFDLTASPNYNFFSILNRSENIILDEIIINDNIRFHYFDVVNTVDGQRFAYQLKENDEII